MNLIEVVGDRVVGKVPWNKRRSPKWGKVRAAYLKKHPACEVCGKSKGLEVHHIEVFFLHPGKELLESNLITLCRKDHLFVAHLNSWKSWNAHVEEDSRRWNNKITCRP
jgi:5-methylcytosine-specific restriction endonuclease McrA